MPGLTRYEVRQANHETSRLGWITCEYCGAPSRTLWYVDSTSADETMCFCSIEHMHQDRRDVQGPPDA